MWCDVEPYTPVTAIRSGWCDVKPYSPVTAMRSEGGDVMLNRHGVVAVLSPQWESGPLVEVGDRCTVGEKELWILADLAVNSSPLDCHCPEVRQTLLEVRKFLLKRGTVEDLYHVGRVDFSQGNNQTH